MRQFIKNLKKYKYLFYELIKKDIKLKYRSSILGLFWTLLEPLLTMIVLTLVFSELLGRGDRYFPVYILSGRLLYSFFSGGTKAALKSIRSHGAMISKVYVPKYMYPAATIVSNYVIFLLSLIVLVGVGAVMKVKPTLHLFGAILPLTILLVLTLGVGLLLATLNVFFRDLEYLWTVALMLI
ncbi:MAG: ABC transporter permease, partial [Lachnospiraceae bacterium]|nr:ABC transporter permease [Lachnospiraceae bacterium]